MPPGQPARRLAQLSPRAGGTRIKDCCSRVGTCEAGEVGSAGAPHAAVILLAAAPRALSCVLEPGSASSVPRCVERSAQETSVRTCLLRSVLLEPQRDHRAQALRELRACSRNDCQAQDTPTHAPGSITAIC